MSERAIRKIVTVTPHVAPVYRPSPPSYAILINRSKAEVLAFAADHPECFVFPFVTLPPEEAPDYRRLYRKDDPRRDFIVQPMYVGNLRPQGSAIRQLVEYALGCKLETCIRVDGSDELPSDATLATTLNPPPRRAP
jgi:hypothetical protein